jgi:hypothetical protein
MVAYGDDNLIAVDKESAPFFNMVTFKLGLKKYFGMEYTMPDKTPIVEPYMEYESIEYLKRTPRTDDDFAGFTVGALPLDLCVDIALWTRKSAVKALGKEGAYLQNMESSLREIFFHGKKVFDHYRNLFIEHYAGTGVITHLTFERLLEEYSDTFCQ